MKPEDVEVPKIYQIVSQLASCLILAMIASLFSVRFWVIAVGGTLGWVTLLIPKSFNAVPKGGVFFTNHLKFNLGDVMGKHF